MGWSGDLDQIRDIWRGEVLDYLKGKHDQFVVYSLGNWEPVVLLWDKGDVMGCFRQRAAWLWTSWSLCRDLRETKEKEVKAIIAGGDKTMEKYGGRVGGEGGAEARPRWKWAV